MCVCGSVFCVSFSLCVQVAGAGQTRTASRGSGKVRKMVCAVFVDSNETMVGLANFTPDDSEKHFESLLLCNLEATDRKLLTLLRSQSWAFVCSTSTGNGVLDSLRHRSIRFVGDLDFVAARDGALNDEVAADYRVCPRKLASFFQSSSHVLSGLLCISSLHR